MSEMKVKVTVDESLTQAEDQGILVVAYPGSRAAYLAQSQAFQEEGPCQEEGHRKALVAGRCLGVACHQLLK